ncbi:short-chain fatty acyl-CoA regulator family protein [Limibaculum sp. FT325]|uniref:helix-turn-helix domain-containing protein n=1 Tax=Thermohalobaculum sediminis TaxID=2939436 RepID=UPI0020BFFBDE|nr:helix-turn-helix transcriptional regulator [Limibaculum sediminis]MCL5775734.1 short-chain fatty acyl-CoA regulator family protein [Limibaculum sediminis]
MKAQKNFIGPRLRQLRREHRQTQAEMARALGLSSAYVNLLENNQRSVSVQVLMKLSEVYGVDWRDIVKDDGPTQLADLRNVVQDPLFSQTRPDIEELRAALDHAPRLAHSFITLHKSYRQLTERLLSVTEGDKDTARRLLGTNPETVVHDLFRQHRNHFEPLEDAADDFREGEEVELDEFYVYLKRRLDRKHGITSQVVPVAAMPNALRYYDETERRILLSQGLDYPNRVFQLTHMLGLIEHRDAMDRLIEGAGIKGAREQARCRVELANYFAAAVLMPYDRVLREADRTGYDIDQIAARFGVSFEQVCHRLTTLGREGRAGVPFFFMRIDKAGNVTKRFNATAFHLAQYGGACPRLDIHVSFRTPGRVIPQFVEMPDGSRYFTINRTVDRPVLARQTQDNRLAVTLGCAIEHAAKLTYAASFQMGDPGLFTPIGINCRLCPRQHCAQRAHQPVHLELPIDVHRRGETRFES